MNDSKIFTEKFTQTNPDLCWKDPNSDMLAWAQEWESVQGNRNHGLGDLNQPCQPKKLGETCPACGKIW